MIRIAIAIVLSLAGLLASGILLQHHVAATVQGDPILGGVCRGGERISCDDVIASKYGKLELGSGDRKLTIPTAGLGFVFFASLTAWFMVIGMPRGSRRWLHALPTAACFIGVLASVGFEIIMFAVLGKFCPLCATTHAATLGLLIVCLLLWRDKSPPVSSTDTTERHPQPYPPARLVVVCVLLAATTSAAGFLWYGHRLQRGYASEYFDRWQNYDKDTKLQFDRFMAQPRKYIPITAADPVRGPADAKHTLVVFSDFLCPVCRGLETELDKRMEEFPGKFKMVFKHFPLDTTCNKHIKSMLHQGACAASVAAHAAQLLRGNDAFWAMHDAMFGLEAGTKFSAKWAITQAEKLGIGEQEYMKRIQTYAVWEHIRENTREGNMLGVDSTPTMFFDGRLLKPWGDRHTWAYLVESDPGPEPTASAPASEPALQPTSAPATAPS